MADFCASTIFGGWWFCKRCGRDICLVCERYFSDSIETMGQSPWDLPDAARPRLLRCNAILTANLLRDAPESQQSSAQFHFRPDLQSVSRFGEDELRRHWLALANFILDGDGSIGDQLKALGLSASGDEVVEVLQEWMTNRPPPTSTTIEEVLSDEEIMALYTKISNPSAQPIPDPAGMEDVSLRYIKIDDEALSNAAFDQLWGRGEPMLVDKVGDKFKISWTPDDFIERFGTQKAGESANS